MSKEVKEVGVASYMPATQGFTMACFKAEDVADGCKLYIEDQAAANKAAEEGELLGKIRDDIGPADFGLTGDAIERAENYARATIAADRASRQVAEKVTCGFCKGTGDGEIGLHGCTDCNGKGYFWEPIEDESAYRQVTNKAEVEPVPYAWVYECLKPFTDGKVWHELFSHDEPVEGKRVRNIRPLYDPPPATTGASTANKAEVDLSSLRRYGYDCILGYMTGMEGGKWYKVEEVLQLLATPPATTGASTVLTDERILKIARECAIDEVTDERRPDMATIIDFAREVAAQAGQVAVPAGFDILPLSATAEMIEAAESVGDLYRMGRPELWGQVWKAMLAAAPSPAKESK